MKKFTFSRPKQASCELGSVRYPQLNDVAEFAVCIWKSKKQLIMIMRDRVRRKSYEILNKKKKKNLERLNKKLCKLNVVPFSITFQN
jgi:hypothetical protein